ncbi:hypothetical protein BGW36DRAFT_426645 [Talaromyces proteolyticus]|uniref:Uncharacterized protein n=1 Tax=Talaromyces proteolyticus TaxID=1131652 RepID=A0AAD4KUD1_9EURO|nr:uncharacterized protein BGW36DRAFT_426645 [Talaromyces proteolyticus]KAH8698965.1 hypothetical protein BGW36DRAFT_426645 [Talaromyces proteolyticus]
MAPRAISLMTYRNSAKQRAHFAIFVPFASNEDVGTLINVVGAPMVGYKLEFERLYSPLKITQAYDKYPIGRIDSEYIMDTDSEGIDSIPRGAVEIAASRISPPRISQNFMAPVNDTTNKRCQEWTMEYICYLVELGYIDVSAIEIVQSKRDPPSHGIGLQPVGIGSIIRT